MKSALQNWQQLVFDHSISFEDRCRDVFSYQIENNPSYQRFVKTFGIKADDYISPDDIPLLPIRAFKDGQVRVESDAEPELIFKSSGTSEMTRSTHYILRKKIYETSILAEFKRHFSFDEYTVVFYLPGYDKNPHSSLIWMAKHLIENDPSEQSRFVSLEDLKNIRSFETESQKKILLFGAAFGLMDVLESGKFSPVSNLEILETGGMKTHRREMTKIELRQAISEGFDMPLDHIHSEYGMCELLSQMYAIGDEWFQAPHWVNVTIRDAENPFKICEAGEEGKIGILDLANVYSCPFILTDDRGVMDSSGRFRVLGRWDSEDLRGCNFLIDDE